MAKQIKILMTTMKMDIGGAETHILELAKELCARGYDITIASNGGVFVRELEECGIRHIVIPYQSKSPMAVLASRKMTRKLFAHEHFDIVHAHARIPAFICGPLARRAGIPFVTTAHLNFAVNALWRKIADWGEQTVAVSDDIKKYLTDEYGIKPDNIIVTINGINTKTYSPDTGFDTIAEEFKLSPEKRRIVLVSRIDTDRSLAALKLAEIAPEIYKKYPNSEIIIVGGGDDFARLEAITGAANAAVGSAFVRLIGARTDINRFIAAGEIFIGVSRAVLEAMAIAKPTILAGNEGYLGIFTKEKFPIAYDSNFCCRSCPMTDAQTLCSDIITLLDMSDDERKSLGLAGREIIEENYSVTRMADDYEEMYRRVLCVK